MSSPAFCPGDDSGQRASVDYTEAGYGGLKGFSSVDDMGSKSGDASADSRMMLCNSP